MFLLGGGVGEVGAHQVNEIGGTHDFEPRIRDDVGRAEHREASKSVCADDTPAQGLALLSLGQVISHRSNGECVIHTEQTLDDNEGDYDWDRLDPFGSGRKGEGKGREEKQAKHKRS